MYIIYITHQTRSSTNKTIHMYPSILYIPKSMYTTFLLHTTTAAILLPHLFNEMIFKGYISAFNILEQHGFSPMCVFAV
ncbi:hypothetical protein BDC45DRAFT_528728 [Circinella umbellata]|nr:hypothetical protein BDC45DRAFT_528728 [Circinella umbellata]